MQMYHPHWIFTLPSMWKKQTNTQRTNKKKINKIKGKKINKTNTSLVWFFTLHPVVVGNREAHKNQELRTSPRQN